MGTETKGNEPLSHLEVTSLLESLGWTREEKTEFAGHMGEAYYGKDGESVAVYPDHYQASNDAVAREALAKDGWTQRSTTAVMARLQLMLQECRDGSYAEIHDLFRKLES